MQLITTEFQLDNKVGPRLNYESRYHELIKHS